MASEDHYTAVVEIVHTKERETGQLRSVPRDPELSREASRGVDRKREVARIVIRDDTIAGLIVKVRAHLELIKD